VQLNRVTERRRRRYRLTMAGHPSAFTVDIGAGGFCTEVMRVLPAGTAIQGSLLVDGAEVAFAGQVAWTKAGEARMSVRGRMGVRFTRIPQDFARIVDEKPRGLRPA